MSQRSIHIIWNSKAGSAAGHAILYETLKARDDVTVVVPNCSGEARQMAAEAARGSADIVVAAGGDGTVSDVVQGLIDAGNGKTLGVIPLGTGNDFCRNLNIPLDPVAAVQLLDANLRRPIDLIRIETAAKTTRYVNMATGGNTGLYTDLITDDMKQFWGPMVYVRGTIDVLLNLEVFRIRIQCDEEPAVEFDALNVFIANGRTSGGGLSVAPDAAPDDGLLDLIVVKDCSAAEIAGLATQYALSDYRANDTIYYRRVGSVSLSAVPPLIFSTDGDVLDDVEKNETIRFAVEPRAIQVVAGAGE